MKYCIYARVSTTYDSQENSFEVQTKDLKKKIKILFKDSDFRRSIVTTFVDKVFIGGERFTITVELKEPLLSYSHRFQHRAPVYFRNGLQQENY